MKDIEDRLKAIETNGINISVFNLLNEASKIYPKIALIVGLTVVVLGILSSIIATITLFLYTKDPVSLLLSMKDFNPLFLQSNELIIYTLALSISTGIFVIFSAGFIKMAADAYFSRPIHLSTTFKYFSNSACLQLFGAHFIITLVFTAVSLYLQMIHLQYVAIAVNWIISSLTVLVTPLIIFGNLSAFAAIKHSVNIVNKQPLQVISLFLLGSLVAAAGLLFFVVGVIFTLPFIYCVYFIIYEKTVGLPEEKN